MLPLLVLLGTIAGAWYLLIVRPQKDQQTRHGRLVERLQVGDHVLTVGGIYGRVVAVEASSVVLELAPGLTSRIATDGIARIVHSGEAALPANMNDGALPALPSHDQVTGPDMHQHPNQQPGQQPAQEPATPYAQPAPQPGWAAAPTMPIPIAQPMPVAQPFQSASTPAVPLTYAHAPVARPPAELPAPPPPGYGSTTLQAQVAPTQQTFEPRPWSDVAPVARPDAPHAGLASMLPPPPRLSAPHGQTAPAPPPQPQHFMPAPQQYAPMPIQPPFAPQAVPQQPVYATPQPAPHAGAVQPAAPAAVTAEAESARPTSRAPKGMGSSLRLDDPSIRDTMDRARAERAGLAVELERHSLPLVDVGHQSAVGEPQPTLSQPQFVGHDSSGVPLFASPGAPGVHPVAQYPTAAELPNGIPRPAIARSNDVPEDPAFRANAFQRSTPYAPGSFAPSARDQPAGVA